MSKSLIKRSLELINSESNETTDNCKKSKSKGTLNLISINQSLISKNKKKDSVNLLSHSNTVNILDIKTELSFKSDYTKENVRKLLCLSNNRLDSNISGKILLRGLKECYTKKKEKSVEEEKTVFTDQDFKKFEAEYIG